VRKPILAAVAVLLFAAPAAAQGERILSYDVAIEIAPSGSILVTERIDYDFGYASRHGIFRDIPDRLEWDETYDRVYPIDILSVEGSAGTPDRYEEEREGSLLRIRIGDPDRTITGRHAYTIVYRVEGALNAFDDHDELYWNAIGDAWDVPIERSRVDVSAPADILEVACFAGPYGVSVSCKRDAFTGGAASFSMGRLNPYEGFSVVVAIPKGAVSEPEPVLEERWSLRRAFDVSPVTVAASAGLLVLVIAGFGWLVVLKGRDRRFTGSVVDMLHGSATGEEEPVSLLEHEAIVPEFAPPDDLRPGQIGTLLDETANPLDVTATFVDLAVRGYLRIAEIPKEGWFGKPDWSLTRLRDAAGLLDYERRLFDGLFQDGDEVVLLSALKSKFVGRLHSVQEALYEDAASRKWFAGRPDKVRRLWQRIGTAVLLAGGGIEYLAVRYTHLGLVPVPIVVGGLLLMIGARAMPSRTAKGTALRRRIFGFREVIDKAEANFSRWAEQENVFSRYLPYAIVFGLTEKWAKAFESLARQAPETGWYVSPYPFAYGTFGESMEGFAVTTAGTITSTPAGSGGSGFGGGGVSGGGGGGGGGGSW